jgi:hypothetical protein
MNVWRCIIHGGKIMTDIRVIVTLHMADDGV